MKVQVFKLRARGKQLPREELQNVAPLEGDLAMVKYQSHTRLYTYAKVTIQHRGGLIDVLCDLYEPKLIGIEGDFMLLDGLEQDKQTGEMHFQRKQPANPSVIGCG